MDDLPALLRLDKACQPPGLRNTEDELCTWLAEGGDRHVILEIDDHIVGAVYSQRIEDVVGIRRHTFRSVGALAREAGPVVQLLSINVVPSLVPLGYGDQLLAFMLRFSALKPGVETVATVVHCRQTGSLREYIHRRPPAGSSVDPELEFHLRQGAIIDGLIANYRPADTQNGGHGVLVVYDLRHRADTAAIAPPVSARTIDSPEDLADTVHSAVRFVLRSRNRRFDFDPRAAFNDMGMDALDRFGLRMLLARSLKTKISPTLFYRYSSPAAIVDCFTRRFFPEIRTAHRVSSIRPARQPGWCADLPGDAVAVVGMACRFPGADDLDSYWDLLAAGREAITETPPERWDMAPFFGRRSEAGKICTSRGGYLSDVAGFDARFFGFVIKF
jgi:rhizoxin synthesis polyketide synthase/nonribosomal peptide synthetase RhiA